MTKATYLTKAGKPTQTFWSTAFDGPRTLRPEAANVTVKVFDCGCKGIHEHSPLSNHREYDLCRKHLWLRRLPRERNLLAVEFYA
jgi:hypothetical protein